MSNKTKNKSSNHEFEYNKDKRIKELEDALKEIKYKFDEAESIANFGFWEVDPVTLDPTWTDGIFKIVGYETEHGQPKYFDQKKFIHPDDWNYFYNALQTVLETGKDFEFDIRAIRPDGSEITVHIIAKPKNDGNGKVIGVRGTAQDFTRLKRLENRLKESKSFYKALFENTGTATIIVDEDTTILMANTQFENLTGYSKEEVEGKMSWEKMVPKECLEIMEKYHYMRRNDNGDAPGNYEAQLIDKNGKKRFILINVAMIPGTKRSLASLTDLTDIRMAEEKLQTTLKRFYTILSNMRAAILLATEENKIEYVNHSFCDYFKLEESPEELVGISSSELNKKIKNIFIDIGDIEGQIKHIGKVISNWKPVIGEEIHLNDGRTFIRDFIPIYVGKERFGRLWLHLDITERKKMEKELAESERRYRYIVEKATAGMFILDKNGTIKYLNEHMAQILGYTKDEMLETHIKNFTDEGADFYRDRKPVEVQIERHNWFKLLDKEGKIFWSNLTVSPIFNSKKKYRGLLGIVNDINLQKGLEEAFLEREEIFTDIIYDMMEILNKVAKDNNKFEINLKEFPKNLDNN